MIKSFNDKEAKKIYNGLRSSKFGSELQKMIQRKLKYLGNAETQNDLRIPPGNHFEALEGRKGFYSIRINNQWRITFCWEDGATEVRIEDYH